MVKKFLYSKSFKYDKSYDERIISKAVFDTDLNLKMTHEVTFESPVTLHYALHEIEKYLSGKITKTYLKANPQIATYYSANDENWMESYLIKGDFLGDHYFVETLKIKDGTLTFKCGS